MNNTKVSVWKGYKIKFDHLIGKDVWYSKIYNMTEEELLKKIEQGRKTGLNYISEYNHKNSLSAEIVNQCKITLIEIWEKQ